MNLLVWHLHIAFVPNTSKWKLKWFGTRRYVAFVIRDMDFARHLSRQPLALGLVAEFRLSLIFLIGTEVPVPASLLRS
ncbi:MAG: hypothetical protein ABL919_03475 [Methylococcales bacterium]|nr:hypothetical protein [Methylococcaceae bacterium]